ncbi:MAG: hypothetical protein COB51_04715 [Moraxellaceae bacterium]|nr:MAG: hypothetical protein COB51_04715 [Moraxellaceae bacterium]
MKTSVRSLSRITLAFMLFMPFELAKANAMSETRLSGFMTTSVTTSNNPSSIFLDYEIDDNINFLADSVLGIQVDSNIDEKTRFSSQLIAKESNDSFDFNAEWLYLARNIHPHLELRAGRLRTPVYLYSDTIYVGVTYPWVRTPDEVYNLFANITRYSGMDLSYDFEFGHSNNNVRLYVGQIKESLEVNGSSLDFESKEMYGIEWTSSTINNQIRMMVMQIRLQPLVADLSLGAAQVIAIADRFTLNQWEFISEYAYRVIPQDDQDAASWGWYGTVAHAFKDYTPYITLALRDDYGTISFVNYTRDSQSITLGTKYHFSPNFATKIEIQYIQAKPGSRGAFIVDPDHNNALLTTIAITARF